MTFPDPRGSVEEAAAHLGVLIICADFITEDVRKDMHQALDTLRNQPAWHKKPTWPGRWIRASENFQQDCWITAEEIVADDFATEIGFFGPIPEIPDFSHDPA